MIPLFAWRRWAVAGVLLLFLLACGKPTPEVDPLRAWVFQGPACDEGEPNCVPMEDDAPNLFWRYPRDHNNDLATQSAPSLSVHCITGKLGFVFDGGGEPIGEGDVTMRIMVSGDPLDSLREFQPDPGSNYEDLVHLRDDPAALWLLLTIIEAEALGEDIVIDARSENGYVGATFGVSGFEENLQRLACGHT